MKRRVLAPAALLAAATLAACGGHDVTDAAIRHSFPTDGVYNRTEAVKVVHKLCTTLADGDTVKPQIVALAYKHMDDGTDMTALGTALRNGVNTACPDSAPDLLDQLASWDTDDEGAQS